MRYLIKDLARLTDLEPARIRKWQERFAFLEPTLGSNGYHYYSNEDLFVLKNVVRLLGEGRSIGEIATLGRRALLSPPDSGRFTTDEWEFLRKLTGESLAPLRATLLGQLKRLGLRAWVRRVAQPMLLLVGAGWEAGVLSVADEHVFSRWFHGLFLEFLNKGTTRWPPLYLCATHPEDEHELGCLLHYGLLVDRGVPARFCGRLDEPELLRELSAHAYRRVSLSVVVPRSDEELRQLKLRIEARFPDLKVRFGGAGLEPRP